MKVNFLIILVLTCIGNLVQAQNDITITNDELERYATMMDSVDQMRIKLVAELTSLVRNNENISIDRYNQLYKIVDDEAKLTAASATPAELKVLNEIRIRKEAGTAAINETYKNLAKDYVGAAAYGKIRKALTADADFKAKYQSLYDKLRADNGG